MAMQDAIVVINAGSSSIKFSLFAIKADDNLQLVHRGKVAAVGEHMQFSLQDSMGKILHEEHLSHYGEFHHSAALKHIWQQQQTQANLFAVQAVGHRVVHGGSLFNAPVRVTQQVMAQLKALIPLSPLHQSHNLRAIEVLSEEQPQLPQVACFDTAFHHTQSPVAQMFGLPRHYFNEGIRRYGFHGLSYEYIANLLPMLAPAIADKKVVIAHLGNGASLCAIQYGKSVATTMGMTPLDGLLMGTRCGAIDPGVVLYLSERYRMGVEELTDLLYHQSGLLGVSGKSHDMRELLADKSIAAKEAVELFVFQVNYFIGAMAAALAGIDGVVFTGGIGECSSVIRALVCERARWLGLDLDEEANQRGGPCISKAGSAVQAWVIPTDEEKVIARHTYQAM